MVIERMVLRKLPNLQNNTPKKKGGGGGGNIRFFFFSGSSQLPVILLRYEDVSEREKERGAKR